VSEIALTPRDSGRSLSVNVGDVLNVELPENLATGYSWQRVDSASDSVLRLRSWEPQATGQPRLGASGVRKAQFEAVAPGSLHIRLALRRPWETGSAGETFTLNVTVR